MLEPHVSVSRSTLHRFLKRLKVRSKKTLYSAEQERPNVAERRSRWSHFRSGIDYRRFVFVDAVLLVATPSLQRWLWKC